MIKREEIESKAEEFGIHAANVERDYVFGWFAIWNLLRQRPQRYPRPEGGNCFRKAYFSGTRFSNDLDFLSIIRD